MALSTLEKQSLLETATLTGREGLAQIGPEWRQLADQCRTATVFQTYEWNAAWWRHFGRRWDRRLRLLTFRDPETHRLVGLAPLMVSCWHGSFLQRLSFLGTGASDYLDVLAAPGQEEAVLQAFYAELMRSRGWQIADLEQMREGSLLRAYPPPAEHLTYFDAPGEPCPYLPLPGDWETLTRQFGKKTRTNIGYYDRALRKVYEVEVACAEDTATLDREMTRLFELHQRRWNQRWLPGVFGSKSIQTFHRDAAAALLERGYLRLFSFRLDGVTQACLYCFAFGDRLCYYQGGFEPTLAKWSLGTVLTAHALQAAIRERREVFDFLRGDEAYKAKWTGASARNCRRFITRGGSGIWSSLAARVHGWEEWVECSVKAWARTRR